MRLGQGLHGGRDQHERESGTLESRGQGAAEVGVHDRDDLRLHLPAHLPEPIGQGRDDRPGTFGRQLGEQDDSNPGVGERLAVEVAEVGVVEVLGRGHSGVRSRFCLRRSSAQHLIRVASQRSTA